MAIEQAYAGVADPDITQLDASGVIYRMVGWTTGSQIRARCYAVHEQGQMTLLFDKAVATAASGHTFDSVRCANTADQYLVILWLDRDTAAGTYELDSAWLDIENSDSVSTFTGIAAVSIDDAGLYDVKQVENAVGGSEYMIAYATSATQVRIRRVTGAVMTAADPNSWNTLITTDHADRVLAVHADAAVANNNGGVVIVYQGTGAAVNDLVMSVLDYNDGTSVGATVLVTDTDREYCAVGIARTTLPAAPTSVRAAIVAEFYEDLTPSTTNGEESFVRSILCLEVGITAFPGALGNSHITRNLNLLSKPYTYTDAEGDKKLRCGLGYKSVRTNADWHEHHAFIADLGLQHWGETADTIRPIPIANYPNANIDTQPHGSCPETSSLPIPLQNIGRRMNHLSNWVLGPDRLCDTRKSRTVVWPGWRRVEEVIADVDFAQATTGGVQLAPTGATIEEITDYLEDPWTANRDDLDYQQPTTNFHGANPLSLYSNTEVQDELLVGGGAPYIYDGVAVVELGFPWVPEIVDVITDATGSTMGAGDYRYVAVYEWTDNKGQLHRSGHGEPFLYEAPGGDGARIIVRTCTLSVKEADWLYPRAASIVIAIYRTNPSEPDVFRRLHSSDVTGFTPADLPRNDPTAWAIEVDDDINELGLLLAPPLTYIDGGDGDFYSELTPTTLPAAHLVANWQNRAWLAGSEELELWYSKENVPTAATGRIAPEFNPALRFFLDVVKGEVTALQPMDDYLVVFTRDGIYSLSGEGPTPLGGGAGYILTVRHEGTGCIEPRSIALTPAGILFQSYKGMYILSKGFELDFISTGAAVEDLIRTAGNVRSGDYLADRHLVAFVANSAVTGGPIVIKYDNYHRMWSTSELLAPNSTAWLSSTAGGCTWRGNERDLSHSVLCQGNLLIERGKDDATPFRDESSAGASRVVRMDIETGWISLAGIMGYKRVREIGIQTELISAADDMTAELDVDANGSFLTTSVESHPFVDAPSYIRVRPLTPKMSAFRLRLYESNELGTVAEHRKITGIAVHVGVKKGPRKVPDSQQV